ncbi:DUF1906 domain-containing protein [Pseudonocardiaceae bacterium YIM PH 21723]|nr:DUF1906 domain-containing protein [Pseudonocardiaceae bacterium YIM PH 21723]
MQGLDYSAGRIPGPAIHAAGYDFAMRYLWFPGQRNSYLTADEAHDLLAAGVAIGLIFESTADRAAEGYAAGAEDGHTIAGQLATVGAPANAAVYCTVDFDATPAQQPSINAYFQGVASILGRARLGAYGGYWPLSRLLDAGLVSYAWQTAAWSGNNIENRAHLYQRVGSVNVAGIDCDTNYYTGPAGLWTGEDMALADEQLPNPNYKPNDPDGGQKSYSAADWMVQGNLKAGRAEAAAQAALSAVQELGAKVEALQVGGIDPATLTAAVKDAVASALSEASVHLDGNLSAKGA